jgi:hypothetical protein
VRNAGSTATYDAWRGVSGIVVSGEGQSGASASR